MRAALLLLAGCGRFGFDGGSVDAGPSDAVDAPIIPTDARVCAAPVGHDDDLDGVDDACDGCPHIPDPSQPNADGDGVNDACDPDPTTAEVIHFFDSFKARRAEWAIAADTAQTYDGKNMIVSMAGTTIMNMPFVPARDVYAIAGRIGAQDTSGDRQIAVQLRDPMEVYAYYCEVYEPGPNPNLFQIGMTYTTDGMTYGSIDYMEQTGRLRDGPFSITFRHDPPNVTCKVPWMGPHDLAGTIPSGITPGRMTLLLTNLALEVDYFVVIRTP